MSAVARRGAKNIGSQVRNQASAAATRQSDTDDDVTDSPSAAVTDELAAAPPGSVDAVELESEPPSDETMQAAFERLTRLVQIVGEQVGGARDESPEPETVVDDARMAQALRVSGAEAVGPRSAAALRSLETTLGAMAGHLDEAESRTREAVQEIGAKLRRFEADTPATSDTIEAAEPSGVPAERAGSATTSFLPDPGPSVARVEVTPGLPNSAASGVDLTADRLQEAAAEIEQRLEAALGRRLDGLEHDIAELRDQLLAGERRTRAAIEEIDQKAADLAAALDRAHSAQRRDSEAIEELTGEVSRINHSVDARISRLDNLQALSLEALGEKVSQINQSLEARIGRATSGQNHAVEKLGAEVARIHQSVEAKLSRLDSDQAQALEKLGERISRTSERLAERIAATDWRSARAIEEVGEQMARASDRLNERSEKLGASLAERMRHGEERTAGILEEAQMRLERLANATKESTTSSFAPRVGPPIAAATPFEDDHLAGFPTWAPPVDAGTAEPAREETDVAARFGNDGPSTGLMTATQPESVAAAANFEPPAPGPAGMVDEPGTPALVLDSPASLEAAIPASSSPKSPSKGGFWRPFGRAV